MAAYRPPPPTCPGSGNCQKLTGPTPVIAWIRAWRARHTVRGTCGKPHPTKAPMPPSAALTQNMVLTHLKPPDQTAHMAPGPTPRVAWTWALPGHTSTVVVTLSNHLGTGVWTGGGGGTFLTIRAVVRKLTVRQGVTVPKTGPCRALRGRGRMLMGVRDPCARTGGGMRPWRATRTGIARHPFLFFFRGGGVQVMASW